MVISAHTLMHPQTLLGHDLIQESSDAVDSYKSTYTYVTSSLLAWDETRGESNVQGNSISADTVLAENSEV
jgi:hypothetical protein